MSSILGSFITGQQAGRQNHAYGQEQSKLAQLQSLTPTALAGDPGALSQLATLDIDHANKVQDHRDGGLRRFEGMISFVDNARATNDPRQLAGAMRQVAPYIKQLTGKDIDPDAPWTDEWSTGWDALKAQVAGAKSGGSNASGVQSTYVNAQGKRVAIMRDGSQLELGDANQSIRVLEQEGALPYGVVTSGGVAGQVVPLSSGQAVQPQAQPPGAYIDPALPPEVQAQIRRSLAAGQEPPSQMVFAGSPGAAAPAGPVRTPTAAEKAAESEAAKQAVQLQYLPQELAMRGQAAVNQTVGTEQAKAQLEREQTLATRQRDANDALGLLGEAERLLPQATGGRLAAAGDAVAGAFGVATDGAQANAALATIAGQLTSKMPRMEGPQSDRDVQMYKEMAGDLANPNLPREIRLAALRQIRRLQAKYTTTGGQLPQRPGPQPGVVEDGYRFKGGNPADPNSWERI